MRASDTIRLVIGTNAGIAVTISLDVPIHLVGFSKGGCVLNQLVTELAGSASPGNGLHSNNDAEGDLSSDLFAKVDSLTGF